jgi:hypothetical protein
MDMSGGSWNARGLWRAGLMTTVAREIAKYELDLV